MQLKMPKKKFKSQIELLKFNKGDIDVLQKLSTYEYGLTQGELVKKTEIKTKGGISKIVFKLLELGLLYKINGDIFVYKIIPERKKEIETFIKAYKKGKDRNNLFSCHAYVLECPVNKLPKLFLDKLTKSEGWLEYIPKNWVGYKQAYLDATIKFHKTKNQCKVYFFFRTIAEDPHMAEKINIEKFLEKKNLLETTYPGLKLGSQRVLASQNYCEVSWLREPIAIEAIKLGLKHKCVEDSYRIGGEWEEKGIDAVNRIKRVFRLRDITTNLDDNNFEKVIKFAESLFS